MTRRRTLIRLALRFRWGASYWIVSSSSFAVAGRTVLVYQPALDELRSQSSDCNPWKQASLRNISMDGGLAASHLLNLYLQIKQVHIDHQAQVVV